MPRVKWSRLQKELDYIEPGKIFVKDRKEGSVGVGNGISELSGSWNEVGNKGHMQAVCLL